MTWPTITTAIPFLRHTYLLYKALDSGKHKLLNNSSPEENCFALNISNEGKGEQALLLRSSEVIAVASLGFLYDLSEGNTAPDYAWWDALLSTTYTFVLIYGENTENWYLLSAEDLIYRFRNQKSIEVQQSWLAFDKREGVLSD